jgi:putative SOS response-associated peptidase YedK
MKLLPDIRQRAVSTRCANHIATRLHSSHNIAPSRNVAPTDPLPVVRYDPRAGERSLDVMRWVWCRSGRRTSKAGFSNINAMAETVDTKPAFREAFERHRCLVPIDNFTNGKRPTVANSLCNRTGRSPPDGTREPVGDVALTGGREGAQFRDRSSQNSDRTDLRSGSGASL